MNRREALKLAGSFALLANVFPRAHAQSENLLANSDFKQGDYEGWTFDPVLQKAGNVEVDRSTRPFSIRLEPNSQNRDKNKPLGIGQMLSAAGLGGQTLAVRGAIRSNGAAGIILAFVLDRKGKTISHVVLQQLDSNEDFGQQNTNLTIPSKAAHIIFAIVTPSASGKVWFSGLSIGARSLGAAVVSLPPRQKVGASITIDAATILKSIPRGMFGANLEWVRNGNSLWDTRKQEVRPEIANLARELGVSIVRYPGGGFADYYHWRDGIGLPEQRPVRPHKLDTGKSAAFLGTHELAAFTRSITAEPMLQANVVSGTSAEAADWVSYCNRPDHPERARNGSPAPFQVRYWEIGNEQYIKPDGSLPLPGDSYLPPESYAARFKEYATAMRAADPKILLGAVGGRNFGYYRLLHDDNWNELLLTQAASHIDFLSIHNGYAPLLVNGAKGIAVDDVYRAMFAFPRQVERNLREVNRDISRFAGPNALRIKIAVTEWGPLFAFSWSNPFIDRVKTLGSALFVATLFQTFLRAERVELLTFFKLIDDGFMGWINGLDAEPKPLFYALQMYSRHFGESLVSCSVAGPVFDTLQAGLIMAESGVPHLDAVASLSADHSKLYLIAVNNHFSESIDTAIRLGGFEPASKARSWTLTGPGMDANNGTDMRGQSRRSGSGSEMIHEGRPGTVRPVAGDVSPVSREFSYSLVPRSVTAMEFSRAQ